MGMLPKNNDIDAVTKAPGVHKIIFENEKVRVLDVIAQPGEKTAMHWHPDNISYIAVGGKLKFTKPDGSTIVVELQPGQVTAPGEGSHEVENIGDSVVHAIQVELKI